MKSSVELACRLPPDSGLLGYIAREMSDDQVIQVVCAAVRYRNYVIDRGRLQMRVLEGHVHGLLTDPARVTVTNV